jgi:hypothetical protein
VLRLRGDQPFWLPIVRRCATEIKDKSVSHSLSGALYQLTPLASVWGYGEHIPSPGTSERPETGRDAEAFS